MNILRDVEEEVKILLLNNDNQEVKFHNIMMTVYTANVDSYLYVMKNLPDLCAQYITTNKHPILLYIPSQIKSIKCLHYFCDFFPILAEKLPLSTVTALLSCALHSYSHYPENNLYSIAWPIFMDILENRLRQWKEIQDMLSDFIIFNQLTRDIIQPGYSQDNLVIPCIHRFDWGRRWYISSERKKTSYKCIL